MGKVLQDVSGLSHFLKHTNYVLFYSIFFIIIFDIYIFIILIGGNPMDRGDWQSAVHRVAESDMTN